MAHSRRRGLDANYDSVLDTMTNVVGILIIVVAVTQLNVHSAVERSQQSLVGEYTEAEVEPVSSEVLAEAQSDKAALEEETADLQEKLHRLEETAPDLAPALEKARDHVADLEEGLREKKARKSEIDRRRRVRDSLKRTVKRLESDLAVAEDKVQSLKGRLENAIAHPAPPPPPLAVRIPSPSKARAAGKEEVAFLVKGGRVYRYDVDGLLDRFRADLKEAVEQGREPNGDRAAFLRWAASFGNAQAYADDTIHLRFVAVQFDAQDVNSLVLVVRVRLRPNAPGDAAADLEKRRSHYLRGLSRLSKRRHWLRFHVYADSFEAYLRARTLAEEKGFEAGWAPSTMDEPMAYLLTGGSEDSRTDGPALGALPD